MRKPNGYWSRMSSNQIIEYISKNHKGKTIGEFRKNNNGVYKIIYKRGLIDTIVERGILVRKQKPNGFFSDLTDSALVSHISEKYRGETISGFAKGKGSSAYNVALERGLVDSLVNNGILVRTRYEDGFFSDMNDEALISYIEKNHKGKKISEIHNSTTYAMALKRGLVDTLVERGILKRGKRINGFFSKMNDDELIKYVSKHHKGESLSDFAGGKDNAAYKVVKERGLTNDLVEKGILINAGGRKRNSTEFLETILEGEIK